MKKNANFWDKRPLTVDMIDYAAQDVLYLPSLHNVLSQDAIAEGVEYQTILDEAQKYNYYASLNLNIKPEKGLLITVLVKNIHDSGIFCSTNLGRSGIVTNKSSKALILANHRIGDFIELKIKKVSKRKNLIYLTFPKPDQNDDDDDAETHGNAEICDQCHDTFCMCQDSPPSEDDEKEKESINLQAPVFKSKKIKGKLKSGLSVMNIKPFIPKIKRKRKQKDIEAS